MTTAAAVAKALADAGIDRVFGLPGGEVLVLIDELRKAGIDFVLMRHEANAGLAAAVVAGAQIAGGLLVPHIGRLFRRRTSLLLVGTSLSAVLLIIIGLVPHFSTVIVLLVIHPYSWR